MRIAIFLEIFYPEINGVITATLDLARNLKARGHHILIVVPRDRKVDQVKEVDGMEVFTVPSVSTFIYPGVRFSNPWDKSLLQKLKDEKIEIVHITGPWTVAWSAINHAKKLGLPVIHTFHTMLNEDTYLLYFVKLKPLVKPGRRVIWWYMEKYLRASDAITAPSRFATAELKRRNPEKAVYHVSNGIDRSRFRGHASREDFAAHFPFCNRKTFLFVGRLGQEKSLDVLVKAFKIASEKDSELRLVLVGDGPNRESLEAEIVSLGLGERVKFLGRVNHEELLRSGLLHYSRGFVTASVTENQPMTVIEAICCDLPLIMADVEGMRELASDNALLFPPGDHEALSGMLLSLAKDDDLYEKLRKGSEVFAEKFDGGFVASEFERLYQELLEKKRL